MIYVDVLSVIVCLSIIILLLLLLLCMVLLTLGHSYTRLEVV